MFEVEVFCFGLPCVFGNLLSKSQDLLLKKGEKITRLENLLSFSILLDVWSEVVSTSLSRKGKL
jgi:hypothetical protein